MLENLNEDVQADAARLFNSMQTKSDKQREKYAVSYNNSKWFNVLKGIFRKTANNKEYAMAVNRYIEMQTKRRLKGKEWLTSGAIAGRVSREFQHVNARELLKTIQSLVDKGKLSPKVLD